MKAFVLAAGLGTRLRPFTLTNPKALVPVRGVPMLERVIMRLKDEGFDDIVINLHHFGDKIEEFVKSRDSFGIRIRFSDERDTLRDTGGGILHTLPLLEETDEPFLIHNVDILSDAPLRKIMDTHVRAGAGASLVMSDRDSSRRLVWDVEGKLKGWHDRVGGRYRPDGFLPVQSDRELAFSGIHVMTPTAVRKEMERQRRSGIFSVIDFYLGSTGHMDVRKIELPQLRLIDIGKPATLSQAEEIFFNNTDGAPGA